jgi:predicted MFS family arabinose efflux permease
VLYYAFAVYLTPMAADLHASAAAVTGALTLAVLVAAVATVPVGRWLDRHGGRTLMTAGSVLATLAVVAWSNVDSLAALYAVFAVIGVASAMALYEPAFAVVVATLSPNRRAGGLLAVTIVAGFASSIFLPLTGALVDALGWRDSLLVLAAVHGAVTIPLHALGVPADRFVRRAGGDLPTEAARRAAVRAAVRAAFRDRGFWFLVAAFVAHGAAIATVAVHLVAYLMHLGHSATFAAAVAGLLGVLSVTGRLVSTGLTRRWSTTTVTAAVFGLQAVAVAALPLVGQGRIGAVACVTAFGLGFGVATIARPAILADRYGTRGYASIAGALTLPSTVAKAAGPLAAAALAATGRYAMVMVAVAGACLVAAAALHRAGTLARPPARAGTTT